MAFLQFVRSRISLLVVLFVVFLVWTTSAASQRAELAVRLINS